jgi:hypothetical protein
MAKFRCNGLNVVLIYDLVSQSTEISIIHETNYWGFLTYYEIGGFVEPDQFDYDLDEICTHGIHYFLTLRAAMSYNIQQGCCFIDGISFNSNGKKEEW